MRPEFIRGRLQPRTIDEKARTVELVASTPNWVERMDAKGTFLEQLEISAAAIDLSRLDGMPLLDSHRQDSLDKVLGIVRAARIEGDQLIVVAEFSPRAEGVWQDVIAGRLTNVSVGYVVSKWAEPPAAANGIRKKTATEWTPIEVSIVPTGADPAAKVRGKEMPEPIVAAPKVNPSPPVIPRAEINAQIRALGATQGLDHTFADPLIDREASVEEARTAALEAIAARRPAAPIARAIVGFSNDAPEIVVGRMAEAVYATRANPAHKLSDEARKYAGYTTLDMARETLGLRGQLQTGLSAADTITRALTTTGDFSAIFADTANRTLRDGYAAVPNTLKALARQTTAKDFRAKTSVQFADTVQLEKVNEAGEYKYGGFVEAKESYRIDTYGKIVGISRQALINDDLGAFTDMSAKMGRSSAEFEAGFLVDLLTSNGGDGPTLEDGKKLFHADHGNLGSSVDAPTVATLDIARIAMRRQTGIDGRPISASPKFILIPPEHEVDVDQLLSTIYAAKIDDANPFTQRLTPMVEARLTNTHRWYVSADPGQVPGLEYAYLLGSEGPQTETRNGFEVDGIEIKVRLDFGAGFTDWRGWFTNAGA